MRSTHDAVNICVALSQSSLRCLQIQHLEADEQGYSSGESVNLNHDSSVYMLHSKLF